MTATRMLGLLVVLVAAATAAPLWALGGPGLADLLAGDAPVDAAMIWWVCLAPLPLVLALATTARTPWAWVVAVVLHVAVVVLVTARLGDLVPGSVWIGVALSVAVGAVAVVAAVVSSRTPAHP